MCVLVRVGGVVNQQHCQTSMLISIRGCCKCALYQLPTIYGNFRSPAYCSCARRLMMMSLGIIANDRHQQQQQQKTTAATDTIRRHRIALLYLSSSNCHCQCCCDCCCHCLCLPAACVINLNLDKKRASVFPCHKALSGWQHFAWLEMAAWRCSKYLI